MSPLRFAFRQMLKNPGFTLLAGGMLTLGVAGNVVVFSLNHAIFLRPMPFPESGRLVDLDETAPKWNLEFTGVAYPDFEAWRDQNQTFEGMAVTRGASFNWSDAGLSERLSGLRVTHGLGGVLGIHPVIGRDFTAADENPGAERVVMISHGAWQRFYAGRPDVLGRIVMLDSQPHSIIGVLPRSARFPSDPGLWVPMVEKPLHWCMQGVGRLNPGVSLEQARADLLRIHRSLVPQRQENEVTSPVVLPLGDRYLGGTEIIGVILQIGVVVVLLIASGNIAGLMLARGLARSGETALRVALGASHWQICRGLLAESILIASLGGVVGILLGIWALDVLLAVLPNEALPPWAEVSVNAATVAFCVGVIAFAAVFAAMMPAIQAMRRRDLHGLLAGGAARATEAAGKLRGLRVLVIGEVACAVLLLICAALLGESLLRVQKTDPGFRADHVLRYNLSLPPAKYANDRAHLAFYAEHLTRVRALPGVVAASAATPPPLEGHWGDFFEAEGSAPSPQNAPTPVTLVRIIQPGYFETMRIPLTGGRAFAEQDGASEGSLAAIVNEMLVQQFWPGQDPIGKRIRARRDGTNPWMKVVGVTKDVKHYGLDRPMRPGIYQPYRQQPQSELTIVVRTANEPTAQVAALRRTLQEQDPDLPMARVGTMQDEVQRSLILRRFYSWTVALLAGIALLLTAAGVYGVIAYVVSRRTREIGIRLAIGAQRTDVLRLVLSEGLVLAGVGATVGLGGGLMASRLMQSLLFSVNPWNPLLYSAVLVLLGAVVVIACLVPALRAMRLNPLDVLRAE